MAFFWNKKADKQEESWNLDFLTMQEKACINPALEIAEGMARQPGSKESLESILQLKEKYLAEMGYRPQSSVKPYTKADIQDILKWVSYTIMLLRDRKQPGTEAVLNGLVQVLKKFHENGIDQKLQASR